MYSELTFKEKIILKSLLLRDFLFFIRFFFKEIEGQEFLVNWHHSKIAKSLEGVYHKKIQNLIFNIPPRHAKTTLLIYWTAWGIAKNPRSLFLYISQSDKLTNDNSRMVRSIITSYQFQEIFGVQISRDTQAKQLWRTSKGGGITTATIGGQIMGFGAGAINDKDEFMGAIIIDDPNKPGIEGSEIQTEEPNEIFIKSIRSRRNGEYTPIILIQQRVFKNDLSGFLLDGKGEIDFEHMCLPVIIKKKALWPKKMGLKEIYRLKKGIRTAHTFQPQYMQNAQDVEGLSFPLHKLKRFARLNKQIEYIKVSAIDTADTGTDSYADIYLFIDGQKVFLYDVVFSQAGITICKNKTVAKHKEHSIENSIVEVNREGSLYISNLREALPLVSFHGKFNTTNKDQRIYAQEAFILEYFHFKAKYRENSDYDKFITQLTDYNKDGKNKHDDAADVCALAAWFIRKMQFIVKSE